MNDRAPPPPPRVSRQRMGSILRMSVCAVFFVSFAAVCYLSLLAPFFGPRVIPAAQLPWMLGVAGLSLLTAPVGWRAIVSLFARRPFATMPFFRASPRMLGLAFALAALYMFLAPGFYAALGTMTLHIGVSIVLLALLAVVNLLLLCTLLATPLVLLLRLLEWSGGWLWRRMSARC